MAATDAIRDTLSFDLASDSVRALNQRLHTGEPADIRVINPGGKHAIGVGIDAPYAVEVDGHVGYYCAGMNKLATVRIRATAASASPRT